MGYSQTAIEVNERPKLRIEKRDQTGSGDFRVVSTQHFGSDGNLAYTEAPSGAAKYYTYNDQGWIASIEESTGSVMASRGYGPHGHPTEADTNDNEQYNDHVRNGLRTSIEYDVVGNKVKGGFVKPNTIGRAYTTFDAGRNEAEFLFDGDFDSARIEVEYGEDGRELSVSRTALALYDGSGRPMSKTTFSYDGYGRLLKRRETVERGSQSIDYSYDALNRITRQKLSNGQRREWTYDAMGRLVATDTSCSTTSDGCEGKGWTTKTYFSHSSGVGSRGKLKQLEQSDGKGGTKKATNSYNSSGQLIKTEHHSEGSESFEYDGRGRVTKPTL